MRPTKIIAAFCLFAIALGGCKKEALEVHPELVGIWNSEYYTSHGGTSIIIEENNEALYKEKANGHTNDYSGKAKMKNDRLKIGKANLNITTYPTYDSEGNYYFESDRGKFFGAYAAVNPNVTVTGSTAVFEWTFSITPADVRDNMSIDYKIASSSAWITINCPQGVDQYALEGLAPATAYEWRIKSVRGTHSSQYSAVQTFTTQ
jgi:hypothetical protein